MLKGVGLLKIEDHGAVEEFYIVAFRGQVAPRRFKSYANATAYYQKILCLWNDHPHKHVKRLLELAESQTYADVA